MKTNENIFNITTGTVVDEVIRMAEKTEIQTGHSVYENYMNKIYNIVVQSSYANEIPIPTEIYEKYSVLLNWLETGEIVKLSKGTITSAYYIELRSMEKFDQAMDLIMERVLEKT